MFYNSAIQMQNAMMLYVAAMDRNVYLSLLKYSSGVNFIPISPHTNKMQSGSKSHAKAEFCPSAFRNCKC